MEIGRLVGRNIRRLRLDRGLSQEVLAFEARLNPSYVSQIETAAKSPTVATLQKLALALKVPIVEFFRETRDQELISRSLPRGHRKTANTSR